jgi:hypothetical protein
VIRQRRAGKSGPPRKNLGDARLSCSIATTYVQLFDSLSTITVGSPVEATVILTVVVL